jgi:hypothetical protein
MLTLSHRGRGTSYGHLMGASEIENLQRALINLGVATQRPAITCKITGVMDDATMMAVNAGLGLLTEELPSWLYLALQGVMVAGSTNATAKKYTGQYATQLTMAVNTAAVKFKVAPVVTPPVYTAPTIVGFFAPGWYKTPIGMALIAVAAFVGYKFFIAPAPKKA